MSADSSWSVRASCWGITGSYVFFSQWINYRHIFSLVTETPWHSSATSFVATQTAWKLFQKSEPADFKEQMGKLRFLYYIVYFIYCTLELPYMLIMTKQITISHIMNGFFCFYTIQSIKMGYVAVKIIIISRQKLRAVLLVTRFKAWWSCNC
jgi:hypothetical protein